MQRHCQYCVCVCVCTVFWTVNHSSGALFAALITTNFRDYISSSKMFYCLLCPLLIFSSILLS